jgi:hypothetical protein
MPGADFYRALATASYLKEELLHERDMHNAMKLCFEKIHKSLDMYQGHYINRLRFHLNRHHTEYLRKVRAMRKEREARRQMDDEEESTAASSSSTRRSMRVGVAQDLANEVKQLRNTIRRKDLEIERLAMLIDERQTDAGTPIATNPTTTTTKFVRIERLLNPYLPSTSGSSSSDDDNATATLPQNTTDPVPARI